MTVRGFTAGMLLGALAAAGCGGSGTARRESPFVVAAAADPESLFAALESRLARAQALQVRYDIHSDGPYPARITGRLECAAGNRVRMTPSGEFARRPFENEVVCDGATMRVSTASGDTDAPAPPLLYEAVVIGLTRMGHLHNLAALAEGEGPDRAEGGVRDWVQASGFRRASGIPAEADSFGVAFDIAVEGNDVADGVLWFDRRTGLPRRREQTVRFPGGEMHVVEAYLEFAVDGPVAAEAFELGH